MFVSDDLSVRVASRSNYVSARDLLDSRLSIHRLLLPA